MRRIIIDKNVLDITITDKAGESYRPILYTFTDEETGQVLKCETYNPKSLPSSDEMNNIISSLSSENNIVKCCNCPNCKVFR